MNMELMDALRQIAEDRGVPMEMLRDALEAALVSAYRRNFGGAHAVRVDLDSGDNVRVFAVRNVVEEVTDPASEVSVEEARQSDPTAEAGSTLEHEVTPREFGRIAAQTAKQVIMQRVRDAEREVIHDEYSRRVGETVTGVVQRVENRHVLVNLGRTDAVIPPSEQAPQDRYRHNERLKVYVMEATKTPRGPQVKVSRTHPGLLKRLFEMEVPEIHDGIVEIKAVAREAGFRSKIAVTSHDVSVDAVGSCVGAKGSRVQMVVDELKGEKIDIIHWDADPVKFISAALSPAKVEKVRLDPDTESAIAVVPDDQLSLAIGRNGQNVRLAVKLTGWKIDIKNATEYQEMAELEAQRQREEMERLMDSIAEEMQKEKVRAAETASADQQEEMPAISFDDISLEAALAETAEQESETAQPEVITVGDLKGVITFDDLLGEIGEATPTLDEEEEAGQKGGRKHKKKSGKSEEEKMLGTAKAKKRSRRAMVEEDEEEFYL